ncbi:MAG: hypothetical protein D4R74_14630 [Betaproteobacteria bacterium]|nr:MAG: hypothetical protein D4R74_14630 [Betaproteobacteria bacterium]
MLNCRRIVNPAIAVPVMRQDRMAVRAWLARHCKTAAAAAAGNCAVPSPGIRAREVDAAAAVSSGAAGSSSAVRAIGLPRHADAARRAAPAIHGYGGIDDDTAG